MGKFNCINRKSKEFKDLKSNLSKALGLTDITVTDETLLDVIDLFVADNDITEVEALDRMEELSKYIEDYFGVNTKYTPDSDLQEQYDEWFNDNIEYINTPYTPTDETNEFEEDAKVITEENAKIINLSNGQRMVVIPNSTLSDDIYYNLSSKSLEDFLKSRHLVHNYKGQLLITKKGAETLDEVEEWFIKDLMKLGYSEDSVSLDRTDNGIRVTVKEPKRKADYIEAEVNHSMSSIKNVIDFLTEKIPALKDKVHYNVSKEEAKKVLGDAYSDNVNSFVHNGEIYLLEGKFLLG